MDTFDAKTILSLFSTLLAGGLFIWVKVLSNRAFKSIDDQVKVVSDRIDRSKTEMVSTHHDLLSKIEKANTDFRLLEKDLAIVSESLKVVKEIKDSIKELVQFKEEVIERYQRKSDFIRESQILANQIESIHKKVDQLDAKLDRTR
ncbi:MAG: hypothetical protein ABIK13_00365 [Patescibacteria group bacterium]